MNHLFSKKFFLSNFYFLLALVGAILTAQSNYNFIQNYGSGFDLFKFIELSTINPAAESLARDLFIGATAVFIWIVNESKKLDIKNMWIIYAGTFLIAFAFSAPLFLCLRERKLIEIQDSIN